MESPALLTLDEAAAYLKLASGTLYNWRHSRIGPKSVKVGSRVRYRQTDLDLWIDASTEAA
jgi:excisionase family DNA binding protein